MTNNKEEKDADMGIPPFVFTSNVLVEKEPIGILHAINQGVISRFNAWQILRLVHDDEIKCGLPQYGIITVFSLSKDIEQFKKLYDQGCDMLRQEGIIDDETEKKLYEELAQTLNKKAKVSVKNPLDKTAKNGKTKKKSSPTNKNKN